VASAAIAAASAAEEREKDHNRDHDQHDDPKLVEDNLDAKKGEHEKNGNLDAAKGENEKKGNLDAKKLSGKKGDYGQDEKQKKGHVCLETPEKTPKYFAIYGGDDSDDWTVQAEGGRSFDDDGADEAKEPAEKSGASAYVVRAVKNREKEVRESDSHEDGHHQQQEQQQQGQDDCDYCNDRWPDGRGNEDGEHGEDGERYTEEAGEGKDGERYTEEAGEGKDGAQDEQWAEECKDEYAERFDEDAAWGDYRDDDDEEW
jgi:hypothetical protein